MADFASDLLTALSFLHSRGLVYCDLKPSNILLDENGHLKLGDFGLTRRVTGDVQSDGAVAALPPAKRGTPAYMVRCVCTSHSPNARVHEVSTARPALHGHTELPGVEVCRRTRRWRTQPCALRAFWKPAPGARCSPLTASLLALNALDFSMFLPGAGAVPTRRMPLGVLGPLRTRLLPVRVPGGAAAVRVHELHGARQRSAVRATAAAAAVHQRPPGAFSHGFAGQGPARAPAGGCRRGSLEPLAPIACALGTIFQWRVR